MMPYTPSGARQDSGDALWSSMEFQWPHELVNPKSVILNSLMGTVMDIRGYLVRRKSDPARYGDEILDILQDYGSHGIRCNPHRLTETTYLKLVENRDMVNREIFRVSARLELALKLSAGRRINDYTALTSAVSADSIEFIKASGLSGHLYLWANEYETPEGLIYALWRQTLMDAAAQGALQASHILKAATQFGPAIPVEMPEFHVPPLEEGAHPGVGDHCRNATLKLIRAAIISSEAYERMTAPFMAEAKVKDIIEAALSGGDENPAHGNYGHGHYGGPNH